MKKEEKDYNIFDWWKKVVFDNFSNFNGRARRKEYWSFQLVNLLLLIVPYVFLMVSLFTAQADGNQPDFGIFGWISIALIVLFALFLLVPSLAVTVRRLHDTNRSGWYFLIGLIPYIGGLITLYFYFSSGTVGRNNYGNDPKTPHDETSEIGIPQE